MSIWIPTSDRLPVEDGEGCGEYVLILTVWNDIDIAKKEWRQGHKPHFWYTKGGTSLEMEDVTHWMLLPEKLMPNAEVDN